MNMNLDVCEKCFNDYGLKHFSEARKSVLETFKSPATFCVEMDKAITGKKTPQQDTIYKMSRLADKIDTSCPYKMEHLVLGDEK